MDEINLKDFIVCQACENKPLLDTLEQILNCDKIDFFRTQDKKLNIFFIENYVIT